MADVPHTAAISRAVRPESLDLKMVARDCVNCGKNFKCLQTSKSHTCSKTCLYEVEKDPKKLKEMKRRDNWVGPVVKPGYKGPHPQAAVKTDDSQFANRKSKISTPIAPPKLKVVEETKPSPMAEAEKNWQRYVTEARGFVKSMNQNRMEIAKRAVAACDIQHGGGAHWSDFKDVFTLKKFAEEIGVSYKTLHGWCRVLTNVVQNIPDGEYDEKSDYHAAVKTSNRVTKKTKREQVLKEFKKWKKRGTDEAALLQIHRRVKSGAYFIHHRAKLEALDAEMLHQLRNNCQSIVNDINKFFRGEK